MQRYDSYKDSGIQWLGEIPSHWKTVTIKNIADSSIPNSFMDGDWIESPVIIDNGIRYLTTGNIGVGIYKEQGTGHISEETFKELNCSEVYPGDILISRLNEPIGRCCIVPDLGKRIIAAVDIVIFRPNQHFYDRLFLVYQMNCYKYSNYTALEARGTTMHRISRSMLGHIKLAIPPLKEQKAISAFLTPIISQIDEAIAQQQKMIDLLNERKQIIINNAVTKGLNPNAKMKPSGIDWIGNIPEHWEVRKLKQIAKLRSGDTISSDQFTTSGFPVFGGNGFRGYTDRYTNEGNYVLIGRQGALCGNVNYADGKFFATEHAVVVYPHSSENVIWLGECIKASNLNQYSQSAAQPGLAVSVIGNVSYPYPPTEERDSIAEYIRQNTERLDCSINNATKQIALLQERKQIIINDVVTGKVKVI